MIALYIEFTFFYPQYKLTLSAQTRNMFFIHTICCEQEKEKEKKEKIKFKKKQVKSFTRGNVTKKTGFVL